MYGLRNIWGKNWVIASAVIFAAAGTGLAYRHFAEKRTVKTVHAAAVQKEHPADAAPFEQAPRETAPMEETGEDIPGSYEDPGTGSLEVLDGDVRVVQDSRVFDTTLALAEIRDTFSGSGEAMPNDTPPAAMEGDTLAVPTGRHLAVEFWQSAVNFRGYRLEDGKLLLYGIMPRPDLLVLQYGESLYCLNNEAWYLLKDYPDFLPFTLVTDTLVISRLKHAIR